MHCPLITDEDHHKLSKRSGHSSFEDLIEAGFVKEAIVNYVALLGWSPEGEQEIYSLEELTRIFDYRHINKSPAVFDMKKMRWMNGEYIKRMDDEEYYDIALSYVEQVVKRDIDKKAIADLMKTRIEVFPDIVPAIDFFEELPEYDISMYTHKKMKTNSENSIVVLRDMIPILESLDSFDAASLQSAISAYIQEKQLKNGQVLWPLRTAVTGKQMTPGGAYEIMPILGKDESLRRIRCGLEKLCH